VITCTRISTLAKALDQTSQGLMDYAAATALQTVVGDPDLLLKAQLVRGDHWRGFKPVVAEAQRRRGKVEADQGTNLHAVVQNLMEGRDVSAIPADIVATARLVQAELAALGCKPVFQEVFVAALDVWAEPLAGTADLVVEHSGTLYVVDYKTTEEVGRNTRFSALAWTIQTTAYAHGLPLPIGHDPKRDRWGRPLVDPAMVATTWPAPMSLKNALVIELARDGSGVASHELDLDPGLVELAVKVREERRKSRL
jgi:hypothetical protein